MEDFPILLVMLIVYLVAASSGKKKKAKKKQRRGFDAAVERREKPQTVHTEADRVDQPVHLHTATQMQRAGEGKDLCRAGGASCEADEAEQASLSEPSSLAQDVLRGVIMSEILTRPHERAAMRRNRQGYHG